MITTFFCLFSFLISQTLKLKAEKKTIPKISLLHTSVVRLYLNSLALYDFQRKFQFG